MPIYAYSQSPGTDRLLSRFLLLVLLPTWLVRFSIFAWKMGLSSEPFFLLLGVFAGIVMPVGFLGMYFRGPCACELHPDCLIVRRRDGSAIEFGYSVMTAVEVRRPAPTATPAPRYTGGYAREVVGFRQVAGFGDCELYVTRQDYAVVIHRARFGSLLLTPDKPDEFAAALQERIGRAMPNTAPVA